VNDGKTGKRWERNTRERREIIIPPSNLMGNANNNEQQE
jgi:hypothetical protein